MALSIPSRLVEFILLGPVDDRRQQQDSPILGDVWIAFAKQPAERLDLGRQCSSRSRKYKFSRLANRSYCRL